MFSMTLLFCNFLTSMYSQEDADETTDDDATTQEQANVAVLQFLLSLGARVNQKDFYGLTPLHHAAMRGNTPCAKILISRDDIALEVS